MESVNQYFKHFTSETYNCYMEAYTLHKGRCYKTLYGRNLSKLECLSLASLPSLVCCLWVRPEAYTRVQHLKWASLPYQQILD